MDQRVLQAQQWVNTTYRNRQGFNVVAEDGKTGWATMYALTRALQIEIGITSPSDNFGPTTMARLTAYGNVGPSSSNMNLRIIAEGALYCKGYSGGALNGSFGDSTEAGLQAMQADMGVAIAVSVWPKVFKAMLTMDAYVLLSGGSASIQDAQRWLNGQYYSFTQFTIGPCDGLFSRNVQIALVYAIQYQLGMTDSQVTGYIGSNTQNGLRTVAAIGLGRTDSGASRGFVHLFQAAMKFNDYDGDWDHAGTFTQRLHDSVVKFQSYCMLDRNGSGDYDTWMSLLVSTGNPEREVTACDFASPLNSATVQTIVDGRYQYVGRYLTGGTNKQLSNSEIALIFDHGLALFPLFQIYGDSASAFNYDQGRSDCRAACTAAGDFGIQHGHVIYFSVDFDALDSDITTYVIPHFQGITDAMEDAGFPYSVGVYGCRNTCIRLENAGLTSRSFVSGMSTGYSGNLGFPLPDNWAFDQIKNLTLAAGTSGKIEVDNDVFSGRDYGVDSVTRPRDPNDAFYTYLTWVEARGTVYRQTYPTPYTPGELAAQYLRLLDPVNDIVKAGMHVSDKVFGAYDHDFIDYVNTAPNTPDRMPLRDPYLLWDCDIAHFGASFGSVVSKPFSTDATIGLADFGSWGGDLLSVLGAYQEDVLRAPVGTPILDPRPWANANIGKGGGYFGRSDAIADIDAVLIGRDFVQDRSQSLVSLVKRYYQTADTARARFGAYYTRRFQNDAVVAYDAAWAMFDRMNALDPSSVGFIRDAFWLEDFGDTTYTFCSDVPGTVRSDVAWAWVDFLNNLTS